MSWVIGQRRSQIKNSHASEYQVLVLPLPNLANSVLFCIAKTFLAVTFGNISQECCCTGVKSILERGMLPENNPV